MNQSIESKLETITRHRPSARTGVKIKYVVLVILGVVSLLYHLWFAYTYGIPMSKHLVVHLGLMMVAVIVISFNPQITRSNGWRRYLDNYLLLPIELVLATGVTVYVWINVERYLYTALGSYSTFDVAAGAVLIILVIDLSRRAFGLVLPIVGVIGIVYTLYGQYFPGILGHAGMSPSRLVTAMTVEFSGLYDLLLQVAATFVVIFIIFAGFLEAFGAMNYFMELGIRMGQYVRSGITQIAVVTSVGMGSVNGSAAANAATTGSFTIPLMKKQGIDSDTAASIESVASTGGQIMPPVMGAAAFIMAEITGTGYIHIITIGLLPALLFYGTIAVAVHLLTLKNGAGTNVLEKKSSTLSAGQTKDPSKTDVDDVAIGTSARPENVSISPSTDSSSLRTLLNGVYLWIPLGVLIWTLVILRYDPFYAGFWATLSVFPAVLGQTLLLNQNYKQVLIDFGKNTLEGCRIGIENAAPITLAVAIIAIFVGVLSLTGFTQALAQSLIGLSGGILAVLLFLTMFAAILFGLGMPTVAAYIVSVILVAPALVNMGIRLETAHFFVFYFAVLSAITPPVAITCIITTEIADGTFWKICQKSLAIGLPLFLLPYVFLLNESILYWSFPETVYLLPMVFLGMICMTIASLDYLAGALSRSSRLLFGGMGVLILFSPIIPTAPQIVRLVAVGGAIATFAMVYNGIGHNITHAGPE